MNYYPDPPPHLDGENENDYRERLLGDDTPFDHPRARECALDDHKHCDNPMRACMCLCHYLPEPEDDVRWIVNEEQEQWELVHLGYGISYCAIDTGVLANSDRRFAAGVLAKLLEGQHASIFAAAIVAPWMSPKEMVTKEKT